MILCSFYDIEISVYTWWIAIMIWFDWFQLFIRSYLTKYMVKNTIMHASKISVLKYQQKWWCIDCCKQLNQQLKLWPHICTLNKFCPSLQSLLGIIYMVESERQNVPILHLHKASNKLVRLIGAAKTCQRLTLRTFLWLPWWRLYLFCHSPYFNHVAISYYPQGINIMDGPNVVILLYSITGVPVTTWHTNAEVTSKERLGISFHLAPNCLFKGLITLKANKSSKLRMCRVLQHDSTWIKFALQHISIVIELFLSLI